MKKWYEKNPCVKTDPYIEKIEELNEKIEALTEDIDDMHNTIVDLTADIESLRPISEHKTTDMVYKQWYHVDNVLGDDDNDGSTWDKCFRTLDKCLDYANKHGKHDVRIALVESPEPYHISSSAYASSVIHISGFYRSSHLAYDTPVTPSSNLPVKLILSNQDRPFAFYSTHLNFQGLEIDVATKITDYEQYFYCDGGISLFSYCKLNNTFCQNGGSLWINGCTVNQLICNYATVRFMGDDTYFTKNQLDRESYTARLYLLGCHCGVHLNTDDTHYLRFSANDDYTYILSSESFLSFRYGNRIIAPALPSGVNALVFGNGCLIADSNQLGDFLTKSISRNCEIENIT